MTQPSKQRSGKHEESPDVLQVNREADENGVGKHRVRVKLTRGIFRPNRSTVHATTNVVGILGLRVSSAWLGGR